MSATDPTAGAGAALGPVVRTTAGAVRGRSHPGGYAFFGVPYAAPPFGPRRFAAPVPPEPWDGVRAATQFAPTAPQPEQGFTIIPEPTIDGGDAPDCLAVNVFTPDPGAAGLPVLVWIHGGGFTNGTSSSPWYDGRSFLRDGVVVVSVGYRLGAEGFLHLPDAPANRAVLDWLAALEWVQANIAAFGGDPDRVTVAGQSAGGAACCTLAGLPRARGLFRAVIAMSGSVALFRTSDEVRATAEAVAAHLGVAPTAAALAAVGPAQLVEAQVAATGGDGMAGLLPFAPHLDDELVTETPLDAITAGRTDHLVVVVGTTADEFVVALSTQELDDERLARRLARLGLDGAGVAHYAATEGPNGARYGRALTDLMFTIPAVRVGEARAERAAAGRGGAVAPTFHYRFTWPSPWPGVGSVHCLDLPFAWDLLDAEGVGAMAGTEPPQGLADRMHRSWVGAIVDGDPGWPPFDAERRLGREFAGPELDGGQSADHLPVDRDLLGDLRRLWP